MIATNLSCFGEFKKTAKASPTNAVTHLSDIEKLGLTKLAFVLQKEFPTSEYTYVFIGRSPSALYAMIDEHKHLFPEAISLTIPLSEVGLIDNFIEFKYTRMADEGQPIIDYFQKMVDHFDTYLSDDLLKLQNGRKLALIDFAVGGDSLGQTKRSFDFYLRYKASQGEHYRNFLNTQTEYVAFTHDAYLKPRIKEAIDAKYKPYAPLLTGMQKMVQVQQLEYSKGGTIEVDMDERIAAINIPKHTWHWEGKIFAMDQLGLPKSLINRFYNQEFDIFSPYGSWNITYGRLLIEKPEPSASFIALKKSLNLCRIQGI